MLESTSRFAVVEIIHNNEGFAIARGYWNGATDEMRLACRWHEMDGIRRPTVAPADWMLLPPRLVVDYLDALDPRGRTVRLTFL